MPPAPPSDETVAPSEGEDPAWGAAAPVPAPREERYTLRGEIARGGLGRILEAEDRELGRAVALKELLQDSPGNRARFLREIRFTARLQHPSIVPVYDAVIGADGVLRYAMKLVTGTTLADAIAAAPTLEARLVLLPSLLAVADAVAYAHARGVIHRDIKPQNILVGGYGETLLIDWGVAKDLGDAEDDEGVEGEAEDAGLTQVGAVVGTPAYMAPEQARGEPADRRADVYALGATLYHLLAGRPPFATPAGPTIEALRTGKRPPPVEALVPEVPPDLASIVRRAMAEAPEARYPSGQELRQDLQRFSTGQLVAARRYTRADLVWRWLRRHRAVVSVVGLAILAVSGSAGVAAARVVEERNIARDALAVAESRTNALTLAHAARSLEADPTEAATWLAAYPPGGVDLDRLFVLAQDVLGRGAARVMARPPAVTCDRVIFGGDDRAVFVVGDTSGRVDAWTGEVSPGFDVSQADLAVALGATEVLITTPAGPLTRFTPDGAGTQVATLPAAPWSMATDGAVVIVGDRSGGVTRVDLATGATKPLVATGARINGVVLHGGAWIAASGDGTLWTGPLDGGAPRLRWRQASPILGLLSRADGGVVFADEAGVVSLLGADDHVRVLTRLPHAIRWLAHGDGDHLVVAADAAGRTTALRLDAGGEGITPPWGESLVLGLAVAPTDGIVAAVLEDGVLHAWRPATGEDLTRRERSKLGGPVAISGDGASIATCAVDSDVRVWATPALRGRVHRGHTGRIFHPVFLPDGRVATDSDDQTVRIWPVADGAPLVLRGHSDQVYGLEASADGRHVVSASNDGLAVVWDTATGAGTTLRGHEGRVRRAIFTADGARVLTGGRDGTLRVWSVDGAALRVTDAHPGGVHWLTFAEDGRTVWTVGRDRTLRRWDPDSGRLDTVAAHLGVEGDTVMRVFALPGDRALTCTDDHTLAIFGADGSSRTLVAPDAVSCPSIEVSPDGRVAAVPVGPSLALVDLDTGTWRALAGLPDDIHAVAWSPDGRLLAIAGLDGTARLLRVADGAEGVVTRSDAGILGVRFSADGRSLAVGGVDHVLWVGPIDEEVLVPRESAELRARIAGLTRARFDEPGR